MEHLTKQQIVLLTLLVSFVTSIATGIVTVSLMDQAPRSITQTINRVVEKTIERVVSDSMTSSNSSQSATVNMTGPIADVVDKVRHSLVQIKPKNGNDDSVTGVGILVSKEGVVITDKSALGTSQESVAVLSDGREFPLQVIQSQINGDIVFLVAITPSSASGKKVEFAASTFAQSLKLGQTVLALSGKKSDNLAQGIMEKVDENSLQTSIIPSDSMIGGPLFNISGELIGIKTSAFSNNNSFYPVSILRPIIPVLSH